MVEGNYTGRLDLSAQSKRILSDGACRVTVTPDSSGLFAIAYRAGLPILAGPESTGWLHEELALLVSEGLSPLAALQAATLNPAKFLRATDSLGTVAVGKLADLVLLDADPLASITNTTRVRAVVADGNYFDREAIDQFMKTRGNLWRSYC